MGDVLRGRGGRGVRRVIITVLCYAVVAVESEESLVFVVEYQQVV